MGLILLKIDLNYVEIVGNTVEILPPSEVEIGWIYLFKSISTPISSSEARCISMVFLLCF